MSVGEAVAMVDIAATVVEISAAAGHVEVPLDVVVLVAEVVAQVVLAAMMEMGMASQDRAAPSQSSTLGRSVAPMQATTPDRPPTP